MRSVKKDLKFLKEKWKLIANPIKPVLPALLDGDEIGPYLDEFSKNITSIRDQIPSISAVYRVKNVEDNLFMSVMSLAPICTEIVCVDNCSDDNTRTVINKLQTNLKRLNVELKFYSYDQPIARYGDGYSHDICDDPTKSIAKYYNYAFSKATCDYVIKADANNLYLPNGLSWLQDCVEKEPDLVFYEGLDVAGRMISSEPRLYRRNLFRYCDGEKYEFLDINTHKYKKIVSYRPKYLHLRNGYSYLA